MPQLRLLWLCLTLLCAMTTLTAQQARFYATVDTDEVLLNSTVSVTYTMENMKDGDFKAPKFDWFQVVGGPSRSTQISIVNGKQSSTLSYTYILLAKKAGTFTLDPATLKLGKNVYETKPITVKVLSSTSKKDATVGDDAFFVRIEASDSIGYVGGQLVLDYVLYTRVEVVEYKLTNEPDYEGFYRYVISDRVRNARREVINGKEYYRQVMKRVGLYPQQTGDYTFGPVTVTIGVPTGSQRQGFMFRRKAKYSYVETDAIDVKVISTPKPAPSSFSGAVGDFRTRWKVDKNKTSTDDAIILTLEFSGTGDLRTIQAPQQDLGSDWEVYDPKLVSEDTQISRGVNQAYKRYEYLVVPTRPGRLVLNPSFSYFDPKVQAYQTIRDDRFTIDVTQGTRTITSDNREIQTRTQLSDVLPSDEAYAYRQTSFAGPLHWGMMGALLLSLFGFMWKRRQIDAAENIDPALKRKMQAESKANRVLAAAQEHYDQQDFKSFYTEVSKALYGFLGDKYDIPVGSLKQDEVLDALTQKGVSTSITGELKEVFDQCRMALYAAASPSNASQTLDKAKNILRGLSA